jgi:membrane-anchored glycerophosphoryl diester phosphodiesterase (GDPDase)
MINFTRAFDSAWERMHVILFRPFDFGKWCALGLSAFLAGFLQGGNGFNTSFNTPNFRRDATYNFTPAPAPKLDFDQFNATINHAMAGLQIGFIIAFALVIIGLIFGFILLIYWLGARGQFMFLDNIVRNRGAISRPWQDYRRQANSLLVFYLVLILISLMLFLPILGVALVMGLPLLEHHRWPEGWEIMGFTTLGLVYIAVATVFGFIVFVFREFGIPLMFRNGLPARPAFWASMNLVRQHTGSIALFVLLRIAIFIGVAILSLIICCVTLPCCCLGQWPYVGTVILLPVLIYVKCFTLDCLAQFGPEYDVWTVDVPPTAPGSLSPIS